MGRSRKPVYAQAYRGFESHSLRHRVCCFHSLSVVLRKVAKIQSLSASLGCRGGNNAVEWPGVMGLFARDSLMGTLGVLMPRTAYPARGEIVKNSFQRAETPNTRLFCPIYWDILKEPI